MSFVNRDTIINAIEMTRKSKVPVLFFGNPGIGKTTVVEAYGRRFNYHVESLCGSGFDRSEVLGYMVNRGGSHLEMMDTEWFDNIIKENENGRPSILFIDEISTAPIDVQGSLYKLIFERRIGNGKKLPDNCLIISAGNYKENLPTYFDVTSPSINRFCVVNVEFKSLHEMSSEFLSDEEELEEDWPEFDNNPLDKETRRQVRNDIQKMFDDMEQNYPQRGDISKGFIDVTNKKLSTIYDGELSNGEVLNFISGRTISYLKRMIIAAIELGVSGDSPFIKKAVDGLIGAGTNSFQDEGQLKVYRNLVKEDVCSIINKYIKDEYKVKEEDIFEKCETISEKVAALTSKIEEFTTKESVEKYLTRISDDMTEKYPIGDNIKYSETLTRVTENSTTLASFTADINALSTLSYALSRSNFRKSFESFGSAITRTIQHYEFYKKYS